MVRIELNVSVNAPSIAPNAMMLAAKDANCHQCARTVRQPAFVSCACAAAIRWQ